jgi:hypothetical protein
VDFGISPVIQAEYLGYPEKMFGRERKFIPVQLRPSIEHGAVRIQFDPVIDATYGNPEFVVMPCRDDAFKVVRSIWHEIQYQDYGAAANIEITSTVFEFRKHNRWWMPPCSAPGIETRSGCFS